MRNNKKENALLLHSEMTYTKITGISDFYNDIVIENGAIPFVIPQ